HVAPRPLEPDRAQRSAGLDLVVNLPEYLRRLLHEVLEGHFHLPLGAGDELVDGRAHLPLSREAMRRAGVLGVGGGRPRDDVGGRRLRIHRAPARLERLDLLRLDRPAPELELPAELFHLAGALAEIVAVADELAV